MAYAPLAMTMNARFSKEQDKSRSQLYLEAYLPPLFELDAPDLDRPESWSLRQGMPRTELPRQVDISLARLTDVGYLPDRLSERTPIIKLQLFKDFTSSDSVKTRIIFGQLDPVAGDGGVIPVRFDDYRDALYIGFYPNLAVTDNDGIVLSYIKRTFNSVVNVYRVDARIHQLSLELQRRRKRTRPPTTPPIRFGAAIFP